MYVTIMLTIACVQCAVLLCWSLRSLWRRLRSTSSPPGRLGA